MSAVVKNILLDFKIGKGSQENFLKDILEALERRNFSLDLLSSVDNGQSYQRYIYASMTSALNLTFLQDKDCAHCALNLEVFR